MNKVLQNIYNLIPDIIKKLKVEDLFLINYLVIFIVTVVITFSLKNNICTIANNKLCSEPKTLEIDGKMNYTCMDSKIYKPIFLSSLFKYISNIIYFSLFCYISFHIYLAINNTKILDIKIFTSILITLVLLILQFILWSFLGIYCKNNYSCVLNGKLINNTEMDNYKYLSVSCDNTITQFRKSIANIVNFVNKFYIILLIGIISFILYLIYH